MKRKIYVTNALREWLLVGFRIDFQNKRVADHLYDVRMLETLGFTVEETKTGMKIT